MRELANTFAELAAVIMILIALAVSTAALSQWANSEIPQTSSTAMPSPGY